MNTSLVLPFEKQFLLIQIKLGKATSTDIVSHSSEQLQISPAKVFAFSSTQSSSLIKIANAVASILVICPTIYLSQKLRT